MEQVSVFYRHNAESGLPTTLLDGKPHASLLDIERNLSAYVDHLLRRAAATSTQHFDHRHFYDFRLCIRGGEGWSRLDPSDAPFAANDWRTLNELLLRTRTRAFDTGDPVLPPPGPWATRYDFAWGVEPGGRLRVRRRLLSSTIPAHAELFRLMTRDRIPEERLPETLVREGQALQGAVQESVDVYDLAALARETRSVLERATMLNHVIYARTVEAVLKRFEVRFPYEMCTWHLAPGVVTALDLPELVARIRARYPGFDLHPTLQGQTVAARLPLGPPPGTVAPVEAPAVVGDVVFGGCRFRHRPYPEALESVLSFIRCHLHFFRFEIEGDIGDLDALSIAPALAEAIPELAGTWSTRCAGAVDPARFWQKQVWRPGSGGGRSTSNMDAFRYGLYDPPYGGAGDSGIAMFEAEIFEGLFGPGHDPSHFEVAAMDPKQSSWFINEWWDYFWVLLNRGRREAIVIYGTATD